MTRDERQEIVVQNFFKAKGRGIFLGSVGFGKTRVAINIIKKLKEKKDSLTVTILVPTTILLKQWKKIINDYELNDTCEVRTFKSLSKKLVNSDLLIIDELHASLSKNGIEIFFYLFTCIGFIKLFNFTNLFCNIFYIHRLVFFTSIWNGC